MRAGYQKYFGRIDQRSKPHQQTMSGDQQGQPPELLERVIDELSCGIAIEARR